MSSATSSSTRRISTEEGRCPTCGADRWSTARSPWWFKFLAVATVIYLGYRTFQGVTWVVHHV